MGTTDFFEQLKKSKRIVRLVIIGDGAVGKTTLIRQLVAKTNSHKGSSGTTPTVDESFEDTVRTPFMSIESWSHEDLTVQCYDLAGQREAGTHPLDLLQDQVLSKIDVFLFVFSLDRFESFENLYNWKTLTIDQANCPESSHYNILIGNKADLANDVNESLYSQYVGDGNIFKKFIKTSALTGQGIDCLLSSLVEAHKHLLDN